MSSNYYSSPSIATTTANNNRGTPGSSSTLASSSGLALSGTTLSGTSFTGTTPNSNNVVLSTNTAAASSSSFLTNPNSPGIDSMFENLFTQQQDLLDISENAFPYLPLTDSLPVGLSSRQSFQDTVWRPRREDSPFVGNFNNSGIPRSIFSSFSDYSTLLGDGDTFNGDASGGNDHHHQHHSADSGVVVNNYADPHSRLPQSVESVKMLITQNDRFLAEIDLLKKMLVDQMKSRNNSVTSCGDHHSPSVPVVQARPSAAVATTNSTQNRNNYHTPQQDNKMKRGGGGGGRIVQSASHTAVHSQEFVSRAYQPRNNQRNTSNFSYRRNSLPPSLFLTPERNESRKAETERKNILQKLIVDTEVSNSSLKNRATDAAKFTPSNYYSAVGSGSVRRPSMLFHPGVASIAEQNPLDVSEEKPNDNKIVYSSQSRNPRHSLTNGTSNVTTTTPKCTMNSQPKRPPTPTPGSAPGSIDRGKDFILPSFLFNRQSSVIDPAFNFSPNPYVTPPPGFHPSHGLHRYNNYSNIEQVQPKRLDFNATPEKARDECGGKWWYLQTTRPSPSGSDSSGDLANSPEDYSPEQNALDLMYKNYQESNVANDATPHKNESDVSSDGSPISLCTISTPSSHGERPITPQVDIMEELRKEVSKNTHDDSPVPVPRRALRKEGHPPMDPFNVNSTDHFVSAPFSESKKKSNVAATATPTRNTASPFSLPSKHSTGLPSSSSHTLPSNSSATAAPNASQFPIPDYASLANAAAIAAVAMQQNVQNPHQFGHITGLQHFNNFFAHSQNAGQHGSISDVASNAAVAASVPFFQYFHYLHAFAALAASNSVNANSGSGTSQVGGGGGGPTSHNSAAMAMAAALGFQVPVAATTNPFETSFTSTSVKDELDLKAKDHREAASRVSECSVVYSIQKFDVDPTRPDATFSQKVFFGGTPWEISNEELFQVFGRFGAKEIIKPGEKVKLARNQKPERAGYLYIIFESGDCVKQLLEACRMKIQIGVFDHKFYYDLYCKKTNKNKQVQVVPCVLKEMKWLADNKEVKADSSRTVFLGALHGMMTASIIREALELNFGQVELVSLDADKYQYTTGSGKAIFTRRESYLKAIQVEYIHFKSDRFEKTIQIDPYMDNDKPCCYCDHSKGLYLCRQCLQYFCDGCFKPFHDRDPAMAKHLGLKKNCGQQRHQQHSPK